MSDDLYLRMKHKLPGDCPLEWQEASITVGLCSRVPVPTPATLVKPRRFVSTGEELSILLLHRPPCAQGWAGLVAWGQEQLFSELGRACTCFGAVPGLSWNSWLLIRGPIFFVLYWVQSWIWGKAFVWVTFQYRYSINLVFSCTIPPAFHWPHLQIQILYGCLLVRLT